MEYLGNVLSNLGLSPPPSPTSVSATSSFNFGGVGDVSVAKRVELPYEKRSALFKALEYEDWDTALKRANSNPEEAQVWIEKTIPEKNIRRCLLPLHAALNLNAPKNVIFAILNAYRGAVKCQDDKEFLPLHLAMKKEEHDQDVVTALLLLNLDGCMVKDSEGQIAVSVYGKNTTQLYQYIETKKWDDVLRRIQWSKQEVSKWVFRLEKNGSLRWKLLPLHAAIIYSAPMKVIQALLDIFPEAANRKDDAGMLAIHLAFRSDSSQDIIDAILKVNPEGIRVKDKHGNLPLAHAKTILADDRKEIVESYANAAVLLERTQLLASAKTQTQDEINDLQLAIMSNQTVHEAEIQKLKRLHKTEIEQTKQKHESEIQQMETTMKSMKEELDRFKKVEANRKKPDGVMKSREM